MNYPGNSFQSPRYYFFSHKIFCRKNFVMDTIQLGQLISEPLVIIRIT